MLAVWLSVSINSYSTPSPASTGMGEPSRHVASISLSISLHTPISCTSYFVIFKNIFFRIFRPISSCEAFLSG